MASILALPKMAQSRRTVWVLKRWVFRVVRIQGFLLKYCGRCGLPTPWTVKQCFGAQGFSVASAVNPQPMPRMSFGFSRSPNHRTFMPCSPSWPQPDSPSSLGPKCCGPSPTCRAKAVSLWCVRSGRTCCGEPRRPRKVACAGVSDRSPKGRDTIGGSMRSTTARSGQAGDAGNRRDVCTETRWDSEELNRKSAFTPLRLITIPLVRFDANPQTRESTNSQSRANVSTENRRSVPALLRGNGSPDRRRKMAQPHAWCVVPAIHKKAPL